MTLHPDSVRLSLFSLVPAVLLVVQSGCSKEVTAHPGKHARASGSTIERDSLQGVPHSKSDAASYSGTDARGVPHYLKRSLSPDDQRVLRDVYGIVSPSHLYISDSTPQGLLKYDPEPKPCATCYVNSYRIGFVSVRKARESWDELQRRVRGLRRSSFPASSLISSSSVTAMDPDVRDEVRQMLDAARRAGFELRVVSTYRSPEQEAVLMADGGGRTHTLTSLHSYGRALDVRIGDGNLKNPSTRRGWIA